MNNRINQRFPQYLKYVTAPFRLSEKTQKSFAGCNEGRQALHFNLRRTGFADFRSGLAVSITGIVGSETGFADFRAGYVDLRSGIAVFRPADKPLPPSFLGRAVKPHRKMMFSLRICKAILQRPGYQNYFSGTLSRPAPAA